MGVRERRAVRPGLEPVEGRELLSGLIAMMSAEAPGVPSAVGVLDGRVHASAASAGASAPFGPGFNAYSGNTGGAGNGNGLTNNSATPLLGNGFPTPRELARETYHAAFAGPFYVLPGRFSDQSTTYAFRGLGGSNFFLHGDFTMGVVTPTDPSAPFLGEAVLNDKSTNSAAIQGLVLSGSRADVDSHGRPTKLTFTADPNVYSGLFFVDAAQGTVTIKYGPHNTAKVNFDGLVYTSGLASPLVNQDLYARHDRPIRNHGSTNLSKIHNA